MNRLVKEFSGPKTVGSSIRELSESISSGSLSPVDLVEATLERIDDLNESFVHT